MIIVSSKLPDIRQTVNSVGKYLYKNLSGAINFKKSSNMFDIWTIVLYQIPQDIVEKYNLTEDKYKELHEMVININITTYQSKIRVNLIEETPDNYTIGCKVFDIEKLKKKNPQAYFNDIMNAIMDYLIRRLEKHYEDYEFLY